MIRYLFATTLLALLLSVADRAEAGYTKIWASHNEKDQIIYDSGNTDNDPQFEVLVGNEPGDPYNNLLDSLYLIDGATKAIEWRFGARRIGTAVARNPYGWNAGPQLADVDGDGRDEILVPCSEDGSTTNLSVMCFDLDGTQGVNDETDPSDLPKTYGLQQNHPNPFNPATTIEYTVSKRSRVTVTVYNMLGQEVRVLVDEQKNPGTYFVNWDGADKKGKELSTGVYFYTLKTESGEASKKMLMLK